MTRFGRSAVTLAVALLLCQAAPTRAADTSGAKRDVTKKAEAAKTEEEGVGGKMFKKAVRGGQNLAFGLVTDVPRTIYYESRDHGALYGSTVGLFKGIGLGAVRTVVGAYELLTFPIPANDYEPVMRPEFPFEPGPSEAFPDAP